MSSLHALLRHRRYSWAYVSAQDVLDVLAAGADLEERHPELQYTPLHVAVSRRGEGRDAIIELLLARGADVSAKTARGDTPLHINAVGYDGTFTVTELLLMHGASCDAQNAQGKTPTHVAAGRARAEFLRHLLDFGADTSVRDYRGNTVLHCAASRPIATQSDDDGYDDPVLDRRCKRHVVRLLLAHETEGAAWSCVEALRATNNAGFAPEALAEYHSDGHDGVAGMLEAALVAGEEAVRAAQTAFAMGHHPRLGQASGVALLPAELVRAVLVHV